MSTVLDDFEIPREIRKEVERVVREKLGTAVLSINFKDVEVSAEGWTLVIEIALPYVAQTADGTGMPSFFGLTRSVRNAMGVVGHSVFPVLRPVSLQA